MTDQRPQYGELATPEEQRRLAGLPPLAEVPFVGTEPAPPLAGPPHVAARTGASPRRRPVDRVVTIALLAYGLVNVIITGLSYLDLPTVMNESMKVLGIDGEFTNFAQGKLWGTIAAVVLAVGWAATAAFSVRRMRASKLSWWVPVVGAVITVVVASLCITVPMMGDPAFAEHINTLSGN